jgi:CubicO group peptidase (beta-lactamase class C family)
MHRRTFLQCALGAPWSAVVLAAVQERDKLEVAADVLTRATSDGQVKGAVLYVRRKGNLFVRSFGSARSPDEMFVLGSISKPISVTALMTLFDRGKFRLEDPARKFIPEFTGGDRDRITIEQLLTHVSGLPDQLPENAALRSGHAPLSEFVAKTVRTPLLFQPGTRYQYSSMAIMLAAEIAHRISGVELSALVEDSVFRPLEMKHSALGLGKFSIDNMMKCQTENAAPESGGGDPAARDWDWNSAYWRRLGAPWGGVHASAPDLGRFFAEFLRREGKAIRPETAQLMLRNHNPEGVTPRGLGFAIGAGAGSPGCSAQTFGHSGSTGTIAWADPRSDTICVVLTTLPGRAARPHPTTLASSRVAEAAA